MNKINTLLRGVYTLGLCLILSQFALAQPGPQPKSVLDFVKTTISDQSNVGFAVTNPTPNYADVQFTLYGLDGNPVTSGLVNPVRYRVAPRGQISILATDLFAASSVDGWVQATSSTAGLTGSYLLGDFAKALEGSAPAAEMSTQVVPLLRQDANNDTTLVVVNPSLGNSTVNIIFYGSGGQQVGIPATVTMAPHAAQRLPLASVPNLPSDNFSARILSSVPVAATAFIKRSNGVLFAPGQPVDQPATLRMAPHFLSGNGFDPVLVLTNPNNSPVPVTLRLIGSNGGPVDPSLQGPVVTTFTIPANGSISKNTSDILGRLFFIPLTVDGWLRIESPNVAIDGVLTLDGTTTVSAIPLQTNAQNQMVYSEIFENQSTMTELVLVNSAAVSANVDLFLLQSDGTTVLQNTITVPANSKSTKLVHDILPDALNQTGSYVFLRSSVPVYSTAVVVSGNTFFANVPPGAVPTPFSPDSAGTTPRIRLQTPSDGLVQSGSRIQVTVSAASANAVFTVGSEVVQPVQVSPIPGIFQLQLPALEPGYAYLRVHTNGADSPPVALHILPPDNSPTQNISGTALYQKIDVTDSGLDLTHPVMFPIRNARVEVRNSISQLVSVSETDAFGRFMLAVPFDPNLTVLVLSRIRAFDLRVADNTNQNALYAISGKVDGTAGNTNLVLMDANRLSGAFNILEVIQRANDTVRTADPNLPPIPVTVFWSARNTHTLGKPAAGQIGTSEFNVGNNTAYILGDRDTDSDEYDDAVIAHEYAHMLAAKYSRDDSPGGIHILGDMLDPRLTWSEGWANFFSSAVRNDPIWRDSHGPNGAQILRYDLSDNSPAADPHPGYWSEASVQSLLWTLLADPENPYPFSAIWGSFADLRNDRWVYLPYFLDHFINRISASTNEVLGLAQARSIDYQPGGVPSVTLPFPTQMTVGTTVSGYVDSYSTRRTNLMTSSHFYTFSTTGGDATILMRIAGLGPGNSPGNSDLDIFLYDVYGRMIDKSDTGLNGQPERMSDKLPASTYVVEVRSYYTKGETGNPVYNSGDYKLSVSVQ